MKKFPEDFYYFGSPDSVAIQDAEIQDRVKRIKKILKKKEKENPDDYSPCYIESGNTIVIGLREEDHKTIIVCRNFYQLDYAFKEEQ